MIDLRTNDAEKVKKADSLSRAIEVMHEMFDVMYQCSSPSISWYEILDITDDGFEYGYDYHFLDYDECDGIYAEFKNRLSLFYQKQLAWQFLNYAPCGNPRTVIDKWVSE